MKAYTQDPPFDPIRISLVIETRDELLDLFHHLDVPLMHLPDSVSRHSIAPLYDLVDKLLTSLDISKE